MTHSVTFIMMSFERSSSEKAGDEWLAPVALSVGGDVDRQIVLLISELLEVHEDMAIVPREVPAVSGTDMCTAGGLDMAMLVWLPDSYDSIRTTGYPFGVVLLDGPSATHSVDVLIRLDMTDTVLARRIPGLASPMVVDGRRDGTLLTSVRGSDPPDFLDTGSPGAVLSGAKASELLLDYVFCL